ncbi:MAG TPA: YbaY family lipoprotein [Plasticicumulans sp.]|nr:YbaY family lipoprotein [Plasticicumulans sp.]
MTVPRHPARQIALAFACSVVLLAACTGPTGSERATVTSDAYRHARPGELTGSVSWLQRLLPPPGAGLTVELIEAGPRARVLAEQRLARLGAPPWRFRLEFDPARIDPAQRYVLRARVDFDGRTRFTNRLDYPVLTHDAPAHVDVIVDAALP